MKIAIVCGTFREGWGYQENFWAEELSRAGHSICVFAAAHRRLIACAPPVGDRAYSLCRLPTWWLPHGVLLSSGLSAAVADFTPEIILWFNVEQGFGRDLLSYDKAPIVSFFGLNRGMHEFDWRKSRISLRERMCAIGWRVLRGRFTRAACQKSRRIVVTVPETREFLHLLFSRKEADRIDPRIFHIPLGFSSHVYEWNVATRRQMRQQMNMNPADVVLCFSCRLSAAAKERRNTDTLMGIRRALETCDTLRAILVGFREDAVSARLRQIAQDGPAGNRVHCLPFVGQQRLNEVYNAADLAIFPNASISCQAALGTGLTVLLANNGTMDHLIREPSQGIFFDPGQPANLTHRIVEVAESLKGCSQACRNARRSTLADACRWLGYDQLTASLFEKVGAPRSKDPASKQARLLQS